MYNKMRFCLNQAVSVNRYKTEQSFEAVLHLDSECKSNPYSSSK